MYLKSTVCFLILCNFLFIVSANDDGQWKKEDLPNKEEAMDEDEPLIPPIKPERTKKSFDLNSTETSSIDDKKLEDLKNFKDSKQVNDTMGRSSGNYGLDELLDAKKDDKEGRIMNSDDEGVLEKPRMNIQGFIPVVGLAGAALGGAAVLNSASQKRQRLFSSTSDSFIDRFSNSQFQQPSYNPSFMTSEHNQYQQNRFNPPRTERRRFSSTLQNLASSISGGVNKLTRRGSKQTIDYSSFANECICVPIYMCRSGFIEQTAKNQPGFGQTYQMSQYNQYRDQSFFEKQLQDAQTELTKYYTPQQINDLLNNLSQQERSQTTNANSNNEPYQESQRNYAAVNSNTNSNSDSEVELPINERSIDGKQTTHFLDSVNATDIQALGRMLGLSNAFSNKNEQNGGCGLLRTCCPLLSAKDVLIAQQSMNAGGSSGHDTHGYMNMNMNNNFNSFRQPQQLPPRQIAPIHAPIPSYPSLPVPVMPQLQSAFPPQQHQPNYPMLGSSIHYGGSLPQPNQVNFNRNLNRKSLDKSPYALNTYSHNNNFQSKSTYSTYLRQISRPVYPGKCGLKPATLNQARVQNLHYPASSTEFGEFPWSVALLKRLGPQDSLFVCGGTLISDQWVISAAHCIKKNTALDLKVRLGEWDVHREDEFYPYVEKDVAQIIKHPQFLPATLENDLVLLRLETPVQLVNNPHIMPACLPNYGENFAGRKCWTAGWGKSAFGTMGEYQSVLKKVDLPVIGHSTCNTILKRTKLGSNYDLHAGFMCAGGEKGKDACEGDGGSALVCDVNGIWKAAGLVSWGIGCGKQGLPGVYVNTGYYENWIRETISEYEKATDESEELENAYSLSNSGRQSEVNSNGGTMAASSTINSDENENGLFEPASIINERSNSQVINGTESDELVISFTKAPTILKTNSTSSN